jgi:hypothetical protein
MKGAKHPRPTCHQGMHMDYFCFISAWSGCFSSMSFNADDVTAKTLSQLFLTQCVCSSKIIFPRTKTGDFQKDHHLFLVTMEDRPIRWPSSVLVRCDMTNSRTTTQQQCPIIWRLTEGYTTDRTTGRNVLVPLALLPTCSATDGFLLKISWTTRTYLVHSQHVLLKDNSITLHLRHQ